MILDKVEAEGEVVHRPDDGVIVVENEYEHWINYFWPDDDDKPDWLVEGRTVKLTLTIESTDEERNPLATEGQL